MVTVYKNEPFVDFSIKENADKMKAALAKVEKELGEEYPLVIGGEKIFTKEKITSLNPSNFKEVIGYSSSADISLAEKAISAAEEAFNTWQYRAQEERADYLFHAAAVIRSRKFEFSAWLVKEAGKNWAEADGDTAEAIDFLEYYGRRMLAMSRGVEITPLFEENNDCYHIPLGIGIVISPWNFPLAILVGMTSAAVVTGNTVIMKPASTTTVIAAKFMEVLEEIGFPPGVVNYLPCSGSGGGVGDFLVQHPKTRFINFTGSKNIGLRINKFAAEISPGQKWIKRVIAEMGGKDAIIVESTADLDCAAEGIVKSAFGFQGQKCSACSRAIIVEDIYDVMIEKIIALTEKLTLGDSSIEGIDMGPVVDEKSFRRILDYIEIGRSEGKLIAGGSSVESDGYFIKPTIFADVDRSARIFQEEIFGPVLAITKAKNYKEAIEIANDSEYGLTGAVYTLKREFIEKAKLEFHVGNLYINRKCTGALVGVNPFGGFNMSGTDSKAGGPEYLNMFMQLKTIAEKY